MAFKQRIRQYSETERALPGVGDEANLDSLIEQLVESIRRIEYVTFLTNKREIDPLRADPSSNIFDPLQAALFHFRADNVDEAIWLVFLATHFGKHQEDGWELCRFVYNGNGNHWTWARINADLNGFTVFLAENLSQLRGEGGITRRFSSHRKYESLNPDSTKGTNSVFESYVRWVGGSNRGHRLLFDDAISAVGDDPEALFDYLYNEMKVLRFGRLGKFDFLTMIGKLGITNISPGRVNTSIIEVAARRSANLAINALATSSPNSLCAFIRLPQT